MAGVLHRDDPGPNRAITDAAGVRVESAVYKPFGEQTEFVTPGLAAPESKGWIGERYDADAGLQYLNARYYDPVLGMFLQPDWFEVLKPGVGTNRFSYSFNDPVNMSDPLGNCPPCAVAGVIEGAKWVGVAVITAYGIYVSNSVDDPPGIGHNSRIIDTPPPSPPEPPNRNQISALATGVAIGAAGGYVGLSDSPKSYEIHGTPQVTNGSGISGKIHGDLSNALAESIVEQYGTENVRAVHFNRPLSSIFSDASTGVRPDVTVELRNGNAVLAEVPSGTQTTLSQDQKLQEAARGLPGRTVTTRVLDTGRGSAARDMIDGSGSTRNRGGLLSALRSLFGL